MGFSLKRHNPHDHGDGDNDDDNGASHVDHVDEWASPYRGTTHMLMIAMLLMMVIMSVNGLTPKEAQPT